MSYEALQGSSEGVDRRAGLPNQGSAGTKDGEIRSAPPEAVREDRYRTDGDGGWTPLPTSEDDP